MTLERDLKGTSLACILLRPIVCITSLNFTIFIIMYISADNILNQKFN